MDATEVFYQRIAPALTASRFLQRECASRDWLVPQLIKTLDFPLDHQLMQLFLEAEATSEETLKARLRRLRSWVLCHTACRDLLGLADLDEVTEAVTLLAEVAVTHARDIWHGILAERHGEPCDGNGQPMEMTIVGMGKLGGRELNVSSDIDLIFLYPEEGETSGSRPLEYHEFFARLGRQVIAALAEVTEDGFVFRVDMRLRPNGDSGPLAMSFDALEHYFIVQGREWERFAWIKARPLCGNRLEELAQVVRPFVFRKYLDFGAINAMRALHGQIMAQIARKEMVGNIKLGPGGIREIEFIAQVFQVIRGGREVGLQKRATVDVLETLADRGMLSAETVQELVMAYRFLRRLEHRLQYLDDAQTHDLPLDAEDCRIIATAMGYLDVSAMLADLERHRAVVTASFQAACGDPNSAEHNLDVLWQAGSSRELMLLKMAELNFREPDVAVDRLCQIRQSSNYRQLPDALRLRFDTLIPRIVEGCNLLPEPDKTFGRMLNLLATISKRGAYLALLQQYPQAMQRLLELVSASKWAADYLTTHPILLDELLDSRCLEDVTDWPVFSGILQEMLKEADPDTEKQMDLMREQHHAQVFRILLQDIAGKWRVEAIGDHLSALADIVLEKTMSWCWHKFEAKHRKSPRFAVIAYGKLGGKELGYASDLDLVFLYDDEHPKAQENYARLAQRMLTWLSSRTSAGILFETDTRLRPNGKSGLLVSGLASFIKYQQESAWVWEHQALTRARYAAGDKKVGEKFEEARRTILCQKRDLTTLAAEICKMRQKLLESHGQRAGLFNLKDDRGGLVDFEFIIQFLVLGYSHSFPQLTANLGNIALARIAGELGLVDAAEAKAAADAYRLLRRMQHRLRLNGEENWVPEQNAIVERQAIGILWQAVLGNDR